MTSGTSNPSPFSVPRPLPDHMNPCNTLAMWESPVPVPDSCQPLMSQRKHMNTKKMSKGVEQELILLFSV